MKTNEHSNARNISSRLCCWMVLFWMHCYCDVSVSLPLPFSILLLSHQQLPTYIICHRITYTHFPFLLILYLSLSSLLSIHKSSQLSLADALTNASIRTELVKTIWLHISPLLLSVFIKTVTNTSHQCRSSFHHQFVVSYIFYIRLHKVEFSITAILSASLPHKTRILLLIPVLLLVYSLATVAFVTLLNKLEAFKFP